MRELEDYEAVEQFTLEFASPVEAIRVNESSDHYEKENIVTFRGMLDRENQVLKLLLEEVKN